MTAECAASSGRRHIMSAIPARASVLFARRPRFVMLGRVIVDVGISVLHSRYCAGAVAVDAPADMQSRPRPTAHSPHRSPEKRDRGGKTLRLWRLSHANR